jgi:hypothetical protein
VLAGGAAPAYDVAAGRDLRMLRLPGEMMWEAIAVSVAEEGGLGGRGGDAGDGGSDGCGRWATVRGSKGSTRFFFFLLLCFLRASTLRMGN